MKFSIFLVLMVFKTVYLFDLNEYQYRSNDESIFMFSTKTGNIHENYDFCMKLGMKVPSVLTKMDEKTLSSQTNRDIEWIWIETSFRDNNDSLCSASCCSMQFSVKKNSTRIVPCTETTASFACVKMIREIKDDITIYNSMKASLERSNQIVFGKIDDTTKEFDNKLLGTKHMIEANSDKIIRTNTEMDNLHSYVEVTRNLNNLDIKKNVELLTTFREYFNQSLIKTSNKNERLSYEINLVSEECKSKIDYVKDSMSELASIAALNNLDFQFSNRLHLYKQTIDKYVRGNKDEMKSMTSEINALQAKLEDSSNELDYYKRVTIYVGIALGITLLFTIGFCYYLFRRSRR